MRKSYTAGKWHYVVRYQFQNRLKDLKKRDWIPGSNCTVLWCCVCKHVYWANEGRAWLGVSFSMLYDSILLGYVHFRFLTYGVQEKTYFHPSLPFWFKYKTLAISTLRIHNSEFCLDHVKGRLRSLLVHQPPPACVVIVFPGSFKSTSFFHGTSRSV